MSKPTAVICAIALNEEPYLDEWISYHLALGFDHIYLYDNTPDKPSPFVQTLSSNAQYQGRVTTVHAPGKAMQYPAYNHFLLSAHAKRHTWVSFHDIDEFIVLHKHATIVDFLLEHCTQGAVGINWMIFGTSNQLGYSSQPLTKRMRYRQPGPDKHIKSICCIANVDKVFNAHYVQFKNTTTTSTLITTHDTNNKPITGPFNPDGPTNIAQINHYYCKSVEEHIKRRGGDDTYTGDGLKQQLATEEHVQKSNTTYDDSAWRFYKNIKNNKNNNTRTIL